MGSNLLQSLVFRYHTTFPKPPGVPDWPEILPAPTIEDIEYRINEGYLLCGDPDEVLEQVKRYEPRTGQIVEVEDERLQGTQTLRFAPAEGGARVSLELDYKLKPGVLLRALVDLFFVRRAMADSMRRTLGRFGRELAAEQELLR
jgi:hypothetical protein